MPKLKSKWPGYAKTLTRFSRLAAEQTTLLDEVAAEDLGKVLTDNRLLEIDKLLLLSRLRQKNCLHYWGKTYGLLAPSSIEIDELVNQLDAAQRKSIKVNFSGMLVRSFSSQLILSAQTEPLPLDNKVEWQDLKQSLLLPNGIKLIAEMSDAKQATAGLRLPHKGETVWLDKRRGGEKCLADYRSKTTDLKTIYQELKVPVWKREWLPLVYFNKQLVAIPGVFVAREYLAQPQQKSLNIKIENS